MGMKENMLSLELLRDFVERVVCVETYMKNLIVDKVETANKRLWALRESLKIDEPAFAEKLNIELKEYHEYEKIGNDVPLEFLKKVAGEFSVPIDWLCCRSPMLPIPEPDKKQ